MEYKDFNEDLIDRTIKILDKYADDYEVTLLINCLTALLILPKEKHFNKIPDDDIEKLQEWGIKNEHIIKVKCHACGYKLNEIVRNMRNSVAHMTIETSSNQKNEIDCIRFENKRSKFQLEITPAALRKFVTKLARFVLNESE
jgi:Zn ribbon nucleic-acid-binding protein